MFILYVPMCISVYVYSAYGGKLIPVSFNVSAYIVFQVDTLKDVVEGVHNSNIIILFFVLGTI